ncbi:aminopeptidase [Umezawaea beigongshangensis]|uniref:aminopeptidase n=1 Tax=Umezawaea beigongshangensis TaxID=2780383 RepID=UPI0027DDA4F2|nr:aminopeptidase [Umezawaea beigongshangensis]
MGRLLRTIVATALAVVQLAATTGHASAAAPDVRDLVAAVPGVRIISETTVSGLRYFVLGYRQPVDHRRPERGTFEQRISLLHRDADRPTVLHTSGYDLSGPGLSEPARLVEGNQISTEQRFFEPSRPQPADWRDLTIWQAANDHHRVVRAFRSIYRAAWLSTGASKGGMTSVYHRRFFPRDVDATIAYVAPNDVIDHHDAYAEFIAEAGDDPACRARLDGVQRQVLQRRGEFTARMVASGNSYSRIFGTPDKALDLMVIETPFTFWQYSTQADCASVPGDGATTDELYAFLDAVVGVGFFSDEGIDPYVVYYQQAGTQLGYPAVREDHLADLLLHRGQDVPRSFVPRDIPVRHQPGVMVDVDAWVRWQGSTLLFVHGENDPWGAEPFRLGPGTRDSFSFTVPGGNHGANIAKLPEPQSARAAATVRRWAGVDAPAAAGRGADLPDPDQVRFALRPRL